MVTILSSRYGKRDFVQSYGREKQKHLNELLSLFLQHTLTPCYGKTSEYETNGMWILGVRNKEFISLTLKLHRCISVCVIGDNSKNDF